MIKIRYIPECLCRFCCRERGEQPEWDTPVSHSMDAESLYFDGTESHKYVKDFNVTAMEEVAYAKALAGSSIHWNTEITSLRDVNLTNGVNPKTLSGRQKLPMLSVVPPAAIIYMAQAMRYGAYDARRTDNSKGYGPYNWREQDIEAMIYVDAAMRHLLAWVDGEGEDGDSGVHPLAHVLATIGILVDAIENKSVIDDRPKIRKNVAERLLKASRRNT